MSFASTLYLCPILDLLTASIPEELEPVDLSVAKSLSHSFLM